MSFLHLVQKKYVRNESPCTTIQATRPSAEQLFNHLKSDQGTVKLNKITGSLIIEFKDIAIDLSEDGTWSHRGI